MSTRVGLVRCDFCQRQFNPHSAARHIPWCKKQQSESKRHRLSSDKLEALERYRWRISYKPSNSNLSSSRSLQNFTQLRQANNLHKLNNQTRQQNHVNSRQRSSINSSASLSSPSASSTTSLSNSITSNGHNNYTAKQAPRPSQRYSDTETKLKRSVSSVTLTKRQGGVALTIAAGPAGKTSRIDSDATSGPATLRAKSVSDLSNMGELVEMLAKRMEEIYAQNQLLIKEIARANCKGDCKGQLAAKQQHDHEQEEEEFELCFHCRAQCSLEANYCHKCGCKMRPSNPTPSRPD